MLTKIYEGTYVNIAKIEAVVRYTDNSVKIFLQCGNTITFPHSDVDAARKTLDTIVHSLEGEI